MFTDIHCHILFDTDDGPQGADMMLEMLDRAYSDGIRVLCATPHFNYDFYGDNTASSDKAFALLSQTAKEKYPDMLIYRGNEIFYHSDCIKYLKNGSCKTINNTKYVLVDFQSDENKYTIIEAIKVLIGSGYRPILAHSERYRGFGTSVKDIEHIKDMGAAIQVNAASVIGKNGLRQKILSNRLISHGICDIVCSDSHDIERRPFCMGETYSYLSKRYNNDTAIILTSENAQRILNNKRISN